MNDITLTGGRKGLSPAQAAALRALLIAIEPVWMHNGLARGVDAQGAQMAVELGFLVWGHPSTVGVDRSAQSVCTRLEEPLPPLDRDNEMVRWPDVRGLVACPGQFKELRRSGTWATVRYGRKAGLTIWFCWPDGTVTVEH